MAVPTYVASAANVTVATINGGGPPAAGDLLIMFWPLGGAALGGSLSTDQNIHCSPDWHKLQTSHTGGIGSVHAVFWKIWQTGDSTTSPTFSFAGSRTSFPFMFLFRGVDQARPFARQSIVRQNNVTSVAGLAETTPVADCLALLTFSQSPRVNTVTPAGWTSRISNGIGSSSSGCSFAGYTKSLATLGTSTGDGATTLSSAADCVTSILVIQPPQTAVRKDIRVRTGSTASPTSTGNQDITGLGFDVKALIVYCANKGDDTTTPDAEFMRGIGADDGVTTAAQRSAGIWHDSGTSNDFGYSDSASIVKMYFAGNSTLASPSLEAQFSRISGGFRLNWTAVQASGVQFNWIALGGSDFRAVVGAKQINASPVTGLPWRPDLVHVLSQNLNTDSDQIRSQGQLSMGWIDAQAGSNISASIDLNANLAPNFVSRDDSFLASMISGTTSYRCEFQQTTADGWSWGGSSTDYFWYLAMYFGNNTAFPYGVEMIDAEVTGVANATQQVPLFAISQTKAAKQAMLVFGTSGTFDQDVSNSGYVEGHVELNGEYPRNQSAIAIAKTTTVSERRYKPSSGFMFHTAGDLDTLAKVGTWTDSRTITWSTNTTTLQAFGLVTIGEIGTVYGVASDSVVITDSLSLVCSYVRPTSDTAVVSDSALTARVIVKTLSDTVAVTDTATKTRTLGRVPSDTAAVSDTLTRATTTVRATSDTAAVSDTAATARVIAKSLSDTVAIADTLTNTRALGRAPTADTAAVSDTLTRATTTVRATIDAAVVSDTLTRATTTVRATIDTAAVSDTAVTARVLARTTSDTALVSDTALTATVVANALTDTVAISETLTRATTTVRATSDTADVSDTLTRATTTVRDTSDTADVSDIALTATIVAKTLSDTADVSDTALTATVVANTLSDTVAISDTVAATRVVGTERSDVIAATDTVSVTASYLVALVDSVAVSDALARAVSKHTGATDAIEAVDATSSAMTLALAISDANVAIDSLGVAASCALTISDSVTTADAVIRSAGDVLTSGTDDAMSIGPLFMNSVESTGLLSMSGDPSPHRIGSVFVVQMGDSVATTDRAVGGPLSISSDPPPYRAGSVFVTRLGDFVTVTDVHTVEAT